MTASATPEPAATDADSVSPSAVEIRRVESAILANIDFAKVVGGQFLVYGWILGFAGPVRKASIELSGVVIDLVMNTTRVPRPDVAKHFSMMTGNDRHGFYALVNLPAQFSFVERMALSVTLSSGETAESFWPVLCYETDVASAIGPHVITLKQLLPHLSKREAKRLMDFGGPALGSPMEKRDSPSLPFTVRFGIDLCCVLENQLIVASGWRYDPLDELTSTEIRVGQSKFRLLDEAVSFDRPDINPEPNIARNRNKKQLAGFNFVYPLPQRDADAEEALFTFSAREASEQLTCPFSENPHEARRDLLSHLSKMESESALVLVDQVVAALDDRPGLQALEVFLGLIRQSIIDRLPSSIQQSKPRYFLHVDQAIPVADKGLFLIGWFNAGSAVSVRVLCHCGSSTFVVSDNWLRHDRADVTAHLASVGIQSIDHAHGFSCYVPLSSGDAPCYLSADSGTGGVRRMRLFVREKPESALQTVRALVTSFNSSHPETRSLMDHQIGPAVGAAWSARSKLLRPQPIRCFGDRPAHPSLSVIVPLYGRHDFAEYQMALFANDAEFQSVELIYIVDDPGILAEFTSVCADLYGVYRVPFVLISPGVNLGFAGANNFAAEVARGQYLLFLNSDVMPKRTQWMGDLLRIYKSLPNPGMLGAKLLYEDGSVQHAGIEFRRYSGWGNLWINDHPYKGQSPLGLDGVHEVDAVTAACALIKASLFRRLGGFSEDYIIGDFEDSDLCLRLGSIGRRSFVDLDVELYHLERQSQNRVGDETWRTNLTLYNCWLHNSRWDEQIAKRARQHLHRSRGMSSSNAHPSDGNSNNGVFHG